MPDSTLATLTDVPTAIDGVSARQNAYLSVSVSAESLADIEEPQDLASEVRRAEREQGTSYESPERAGRNIVRSAMPHFYFNPAMDSTSKIRMPALPPTTFS